MSIQPKKIFIIDDDEMLTEALSDYLTREVPHQVSVFNNGEDCLKQLFEQPEIVIIDFHLNSIEKDAENGLLILEKIKKSLPSIRAIMLSSQEKYTIVAETIQKGAEDYVIKDKDAFQKITRIIESL